jgi:hypothetical protein
MIIEGESEGGGESEGEGECKRVVSGEGVRGDIRRL